MPLEGGGEPEDSFICLLMAEISSMKR